MKLHSLTLVVLCHRVVTAGYILWGSVAK